jgi:RecB family endonuclease NucS
MVRRSKQIEKSKRYGVTGDLISKYEEDLRRKSRQRSSNGSSIRITASNTLLKKSGGKWGFDSEKALEDFVHDNLNSLLGMTPLRRQYSVNREVCDILAIDQNKRLVVIELKNSEDRYIVQQLTRYFASLRQEKAFPPEVDSHQPSRLIAITPRFHNHNLIDREYSKLCFEFLEFEAVHENNHFYLILKNIDTGKIIKTEILYQEKDAYKLSENLPDPPKALQNILSKATANATKRLLEIRERILGFHERIQEITATGVVKYGRGKTKLCAEIRLNSSGLSPLPDSPGITSLPDSSVGRPLLYLYLPMLRVGKSAVGRMQIWTNDWKNIAILGSMRYILKTGKPDEIEFWRTLLV